MISLKKATYILIILVLTLSLNGYSQEIFSTDINLNWQQNKNIKDANFDYSIQSEQYPGLLAYHTTFALENDEAIEISLSNTTSIIISPDSASNTLLNNLSKDFKISTQYLYNRGEKTADIKVECYKTNNANEVYKLNTFTLNTKIIKTDIGSTARTYASNSVLASGDWYKVAIAKSGIYKITASQMQTMGFSISNLNINHIRVYGNGGGMLPESNSTFRYDDIIENSIQVNDINSNGKFDANDYFIFYAKGPNTWHYSSSMKNFYHQKNIYDDYSYYFITVKSGNGKRVANDPNSYPVANKFVNEFSDFAFHENDSLNLIKTGRNWYGEHYSIENSHIFHFNFPNIIANESALVRSKTAARSTLNSTMYFNSNGTEHTVQFSATSTHYLSYYGDIRTDTFHFKTSNSSIRINTVYSKPSSSSQAWMDFVEVNARRHLTMVGGQMMFRDPKSIGANNTVEYTLENANSNIDIWEVSNHTEPYIMAHTISNNTMKFIASADSLRTYIAHYGGYITPKFIGKVSNQNLHSLSNIDYVILYDNIFKSQAEKLADFHRINSNLSVYTSTLEPVYNEFGSGARDISAIRDFMKMLYDKANGDISKMPKYLLFFGDASYDYKNRIANNTNLLPTFESKNSLSPTGSYCTDDFFGLLDNGEGNNSNGDLDIGIGRFPITTTEQADAMINKILQYTATGDYNNNSSCSVGNNSSNMADWRNKLCFIGDDEDNGIHTSQANYLANYTYINYPVYNVDKLFFDAYPQIITPGGQRYPDVKNAINSSVEKGSLIINYTGHGGEEGWAHESVLEVSDINAWKNISNLPLFITATCEFSRYDDPERISAGEYVLLNKDGGGIALLTTSRVSWSSSNFALNKVIFQNILKKDNGEYPRLGDIVRLSKVGAGSISNNRNFLLLGDPAMQLAYPEGEVVTTDITDSKTGQQLDTISALQQVNIKGEVRFNGVVNSNFNGKVDVTIYDKIKEYTTLGNDDGSPIYTFKLQKSIIYKGKAEATNGLFDFDFVVPKDISYKFGNGKISYYASNDTIDANGYSDTLNIGGSYLFADDDTEGPGIELYINNTNFIDNGITDENPKLLAFVFDEHGINTVGNGIGHDISAIIDSKTTTPIILNDYYEAELGNFKKGVINYPFYKLDDGPHTLDVKVWDVYNNSSSASIRFIVASNNEMAMDNLFNAPNPFIDNTSIVFEHNQACNTLDVEVRIFNNSGQIVRIIKTNVNASGYRVGPGEIVWNGTSSNGTALAKGLYVYNVRYKITKEDGSEGYKELSSKMVLLR